MSERSWFFILSIIAVVILTGCTPSQESFNLTRLEQNISDHTRPYLMIVAPKNAKNKVKLYYHGESVASGGFTEVKQRLKEITITDNEMIIETTEDTFIFEKRSDIIAVDGDNILYRIDYEKNYPAS